jgi:serine/threonine protein phosphatase PrpC
VAGSYGKLPARGDFVRAGLPRDLIERFPRPPVAWRDVAPAHPHHPLVQELLEADAIGPEQVEKHPRSNVITRAVGAELDGSALDKVSDRLVPGDRFLPCSDGLCKTLSNGALTDLLGAVDGVEPQAPVDAALALDASDNVTAIAVEFTG